MLQNDERVESIIKSKQLDYKVVRYEYNKKRHFLTNQTSITDLAKEEQVWIGFYLKINFHYFVKIWGNLCGLAVTYKFTL